MIFYLSVNVSDCCVVVIVLLVRTMHCFALQFISWLQCRSGLFYLGYLPNNGFWRTSLPTISQI